MHPVGPGGPSQHPADQLIRELLATGRPATPTEVDQILERIATVPFDPRILRVPLPLQGVTHLGRTLGTREAALDIHLVQRVIGDEQWPLGTTAAHYLTDIQQAVMAAAARLLVYERRGGSMAATLTAIEEVLPQARRGSRALPWCFVVYSADRGTITSGYQATGTQTPSIPGDARWLR